MDKAEALARLTALLQLAHSGELAAAHAYHGHWRSLSDPKEREEVKKIEQDELDHRACVRNMLDALGSPPEPWRERKMNLIGRTIGALCHLGGWFIPMYGAGKLESKNVAEYEHAARYALEAGKTEWVEELLHMAEVEWDHELYFREKCMSHPLWRLFPRWTVPPPRLAIRDSFADFRRLLAA